MPPPRSGQEKVAILLLALGEPLGTRLLQNFDPADVRGILDSATALGNVGRDDLETLIDEFAAHFGKTLGLETDSHQVRSLLEAAFPEGQLDSMLGGPRIVPREPVWTSFAAGAENTLVPYLLDEHPQTVAHILSNLQPDLAATCLTTLPRELRDTVTRRLLKLQPVAERASQIVQTCLQEDLLAKSDTGLEDQCRSRLAVLMNKMDRAQSSEILDSLMHSRPGEARTLRAMIFSFEDIDKLDQAARLALFDKVATDQVIPALRGMAAEFREVILSSMGARARRMVEAELKDDDGQMSKQTPAARRAIADLALTMASNGDIALPTGEAAAA